MCLSFWYIFWVNTWNFIRKTIKGLSYFDLFMPLALVNRQTESRIYGVRQGQQVEFPSAERDAVFVWVAGANGISGHDAAPVGYKRAVRDAFQSVRRKNLFYKDAEPHEPSWARHFLLPTLWSNPPQRWCTCLRRWFLEADPAGGSPPFRMGFQRLRVVLVRLPVSTAACLTGTAGKTERTKESGLNSFQRSVHIQMPWN